MEPLSEQTISKNPFEQFEKWFKVVYQSDVPESTAVILATCTPDLKPSARAVLMKDYSEDGFVFFTNYNSRKAEELDANPNAALLFYWGLLDRQIRIEGKVEKVSAEISDQYFASRPKRSRISALASPQSRIIEKENLDEKVAELSKQYEAGDYVPRPEHWGGYRLNPVYFEFWQGKADRLHDRICYKKHEDGSWQIYRLAP